MLSTGYKRASRSSLGRLFVGARISVHRYTPSTTALAHVGIISTRTASQPVYLSHIRCSSTKQSSEKGVNDRIQQVHNAAPDPYPRLTSNSHTLDVSEFRSRYEHLESNQVVENDIVVLRGRIRSHRLAGSKLIFFDIVQNGHKVQAMCNQRVLAGVTPEKFKDLYRLLRRGDAFSIIGNPHRTGRGELTVQATELPQLLSPSLHDVPVDAHEHETSPYPRHVQFLADQRTADILRVRSTIIQYIRQFFLDRSFMEVNTPVIAGEAGGATARPFITSATEFAEKQLSLRIAPELWLKRLVVGGFDKVFEIGPSFRNEGLDKTHNPEFTTCEFYNAYANLEDVMSLTEEFLSGMASHLKQFKENIHSSLQSPQADFTTPFRRIDFIPAIEEAIGRTLPDLTGPNAEDEVRRLFHDLSLPLPDLPTLPRLMDKLSSTYIEPQCHDPTFIVNPPECLSPLSKSFKHPSCNQRVAARCELFIDGREYINAYEEENSPFEQRRKFREQRVYNKDTNEWGEVDENYLQALEWGLPPTGGWGCGVDRLCMLFTNSKRISDVLPFGNLRAVTRRSDAADETTG